MKTTRRITQGLFLLLFLFLFLQTESKGQDELGYPIRLFLDFDPLLFLSTLLASHHVPKAFFLSLILVAATALLGRVFCGWVCPLGTLNNMVGAMKRWPSRAPARDWHRVKYYLLIGLLVTSIFTFQLVGIFDPLSLTVRSFALGIYPAFNFALNGFLDVLYAVDNGGVTAAADKVYSLLGGTVLAFQQPYFRQAVPITGLFLLILALNLVERRFWCRHLCPLGAMLGLLSRFSLLKRSVSEGCDGCGACNIHCQGDALPHEEEKWKPTECFYCWNCDDPCPQNPVRFGFSLKSAPAGPDLGRRKILSAAFAGAASAAILRTTPAFMPMKPGPLLIRPPGSLPEEDFLAKCVKCGECMKVCTTNGLQPTFLEAGLEGIWSPILVPRIGYCEYQCTLCGQVCPSGAIRRLAVQEKVQFRIGTAMIDKGRCLPYAHSTPCIVCEEVCPTPTKAIWFEETTVANRDGDPVDVKQPHVDLDLCIGCGICETKCPVIDRPAIYVTSIGESRSRDNQLLLGSEGYY